MQIGNFELTIPGGKETPDGYVKMNHGQVFTVRMRNLLIGKRATARVKVNGEDVGSYRLGRASVLVLEHPQNDNGRFTFYSLDSKEAAHIGLDRVSAADLGLVQVTFVPEKWDETTEVGVETFGGAYVAGNIETFGGDFVGRDAYYYSSTRSISTGFERASKSLAGGQSMGAGGVGLSGKSEQKMKPVAPMALDEENAVTISLRLVLNMDEPRPIKTVKANPVPPPVR